MNGCGQPLHHREHRQIASHQVPDPTQAQGDQLGFNAAPSTKFETVVNSVFAELSFPIVTSTMNVPWVRSLELSAAWRYEKFENKDQYAHTTASFDNVNQDENFGGTPRLSLRYQPIADLMLRANFNQSFLSSGKNRIVRSRFTARHLLSIPHPGQQATPPHLTRETVLLIPENLIQLLRVHRLHVVLIDPDCFGPRAVLLVIVSR